MGAIFFSLASFYFDTQFSQMVSLIRNDLLTEFFLGITFVSSGIIIFFFLTSLFLWKEHKRKYILPLWVTLLFSALVSFILKVLLHRPRPFQQGIVSILPVLEKASHLTWNFSFPSFQAMLVFCSIPILSKEFPKLKNVWIVFAVLVAFSRVYFGLHFLSDVVVGGAIGYLIGILILRIEQKTNFFDKAYKKVFRR